MSNKGTQPGINWRDWTAPRYWPTWIGLGLLWLITRLPFDGVMAIGRTVVPAVLYLIPGRRRVLQRNLAMALPGADHRDIARRSLRHTGMGIMETAWLFFRSTEELMSRVTTVGAENLDAAIAQGKGVLLLQPHFSLLDFNCCFIATRWPACCVYDPPKNALFDRFLQAARERYVERAIPNGDVRNMIRRLRKAEVIWFSPDQAVSASRGGVETRFFDQPVLTTSGTARMIAMTGAVIVPLTPIRSDDGKHYTQRFDPAVTVDTSDISSATQQINDRLEAQIRQHPEQYIWLHKRFKPPGPHVTNPYAGIKA